LLDGHEDAGFTLGFIDDNPSAPGQKLIWSLPRQFELIEVVQINEAPVLFPEEVVQQGGFPSLPSTGQDHYGMILGRSAEDGF
jgi:hypothetical protein